MERAGTAKQTTRRTTVSALTEQAAPAKDGDAKQQIIDFLTGFTADSMQLLETGLFDKYGIEKFGVAGHPEGSPDMPDEAVKHALAWKNAFAERTGAAVYAGRRSGATPSPMAGSP